MKRILKPVFIIAIVAVAMIGVMVPSVFAERASIDDYKNMEIIISDVKIVEQEYRDFISYTVNMRDSNLKVHEDYRILPKVIRTYIDFDDGEDAWSLSNDPKTFSGYTQDGEEGCEWADDYHYLSGAYGGIYSFKMCHYVEKNYDEFLIILDYSKDIMDYPGDSILDRSRIIEQISKDNGIFGTTVTQSPVEELKNEEPAISNRYTSEYGFSFLPPKGASAEYFSDPIDSKVIPEHTFQPIVLYSYPSMDYDYVEPLMAVAVQEIPSGYVPQFSRLSNQQVVDFIINGMNKLNISGNIVSSDFERIDNGIYAKMEMDSDLELDMKYNFHYWAYENGLNVWVMLSAEPMAYKSSLVIFDELIDSVHFVDMAVDEKEGGGCLIATATYGSELAPQVQQLRELRDNQLLNSESGTAFMGTFNDDYYTFSPIIADYERENPYFKEAVKLAITPMISTLSLMENAESESEVLSIGISVIMLNLGMYLAVPAIVVIGIRKRF